MTLHDFRNPPPLGGDRFSQPVAYEPTYAGFWLRFVAVIIDVIILSIISAILGGILGGAMEAAGADPKTIFGISQLLGLIVGIIYFCGMESSARQATFGKSLLGLRVTDLDGNRISFLRALGRYFAKILSGITLCIGYFMAGFTARKQALHDMIASTLVIRA